MKMDTVCFSCSQVPFTGRFDRHLSPFDTDHAMGTPHLYRYCPLLRFHIVGKCDKSEESLMFKASCFTASYLCGYFAGRCHVMSCHFLQTGWHIELTAYDRALAEGMLCQQASSIMHNYWLICQIRHSWERSLSTGISACVTMT